MGYRLQILVNNKYEDVELNDKFSISFNYTVKDFNSPSDIKTGYSKTITIEGTPHNNKILANIYSLNSVYVTVDPNKKIDCILSYNGMLVRTGYIVINSITKQGHSVSYKCTMYDDTTKLLYDIKYDKDGNERTLDSLNLGFDDEYDTYEYGFRYTMDSWSRFGNLTGPNNILYVPTMDVSNSIKSFITPIYGYTGLYDDFDSSHVLVQCQDKNGIPYSFNSETEAVKPPLYLDANTKSYDVTKTKPLFGEKLASEQKEGDNTVIYSNFGGWYTYEIERDLHPNEARTILANRLPLGIDLGKTWDIICSNFNIDDSDVYDKVHEIFDNTFMMLDVKKEVLDKANYYFSDEDYALYPNKDDLGDKTLLDFNSTPEDPSVKQQYWGNYDINQLLINRNYNIYATERVTPFNVIKDDTKFHITISPILTSKYKNPDGNDKDNIKCFYTADMHNNPRVPFQVYTPQGGAFSSTRIRMCDYLHHINIIVYIIDIETKNWQQGMWQKRVVVPVVGAETTDVDLRNYIENNINSICDDLTPEDGRATHVIERQHLFTQLYRNDKVVEGTELRFKDMDVYISLPEGTSVLEPTIKISTVSSHLLLPWVRNIQEQTEKLPEHPGHTGVLSMLYDNNIPDDCYLDVYSGNYYAVSSQGARYIKMIHEGNKINKLVNTKSLLRPRSIISIIKTLWNDRFYWPGSTGYLEKVIAYVELYNNYIQLQGPHFIRIQNNNDAWLEQYDLSTQLSVNIYSGSEELVSPTINKFNTLNSTKVFDTFINMCKLLNITVLNDSYSINRNLKCVFANNLYDKLRVVDITKDVENNLSIVPTVLESGVYNYSLDTVKAYSDDLLLAKNPNYNTNVVTFDYDINNTPVDVFETLDFKSVSNYKLYSTWFNPNVLEIKTKYGHEITPNQYNAVNKGYQIKQTLYKMDNTTKELKSVELESGGLMYNIPVNSNYIRNCYDETDYICLFDKDLKKTDFASALVSFNYIRESSAPMTITEDIPAEKQILNKYCYPLFIKRDTTSLKQERILWDIHTETYKNADDIYFETYSLPMFNNYKTITNSDSSKTNIILGCTDLDYDKYEIEGNKINIYDNYFLKYYSFMLNKNNKKIKLKVRLNSYDIIQILTSIYYLDNSYWVIMKVNNFDVTKEYNEVELVQIDYKKYQEVKSEEARKQRPDNPFEDLTPEPIENGES